jgi:hypothetical protein
MDHDRALWIDELQRATGELAAVSLTLAEAAALRARIHELIGGLGAGPVLVLNTAGQGCPEPLRSVV